MGHPFKVWKLAAHFLVPKLGLYIHCLLSEQLTIKLNNEYAPLTPVKAMGFGQQVFFASLFSLGIAFVKVHGFGGPTILTFDNLPPIYAP